MIQEFENVWFYRGRKPILRDISFHQPENVSIGVIGGRGSGKSTLVRLALGSLPAARGRIRRVGTMSPVIGSPATIHEKLTGEEITRLTAGFYNVDARSLGQFVREFAELGDKFFQAFGHFNSTERLRFRFSLTYGVRCDCYVSDGKLLAGDPEFKAKCQELALARKRASTFFFTTQKPSDLRLLADVAAVLEAGNLKFYPDVEAAIATFESTLS